jgi:hypothetical protein
MLERLLGTRRAPRFVQDIQSSTHCILRVSFGSAQRICVTVFFAMTARSTYSQRVSCARNVMNCSMQNFEPKLPKLQSKHVLDALLVKVPNIVPSDNREGPHDVGRKGQTAASLAQFALCHSKHQLTRLILRRVGRKQHKPDTNSSQRVLQWLDDSLSQMNSTVVGDKNVTSRQHLSSRASGHSFVMPSELHTNTTADIPAPRCTAARTRAIAPLCWSQRAGSRGRCR